MPILDRVWVDGGCAGQSRSESAVAAFRCPCLLCSPSSFLSTSHIVNGVLRSLGMSPEVHSWYRVQALTNRHQTLTDLNDFITPSQACIKPVEQTNKPEPQDAGAAAVCSCRPSAYSVLLTLSMEDANSSRFKRVLLRSLDERIHRRAIGSREAETDHSGD